MQVGRGSVKQSKPCILAGASIQEPLVNARMPSETSRQIDRRMDGRVEQQTWWVKGVTCDQPKTERNI